MTISGIGNNNFYPGQLSATKGSGAGMSHRLNPASVFEALDKDDSEGLDRVELADMADSVGDAAGQALDIEALFEAYDENGDGALSQEEAQAAMAANRPSGPPPGAGMGGMAPPSPPDSTRLIKELDENGDDGLNETEAQPLADMISAATGEEMAVQNLFSTYDADDNGILSEEETSKALEENRPDETVQQVEESSAAGSSDFASMIALENYSKMAALAIDQTDVPMQLYSGDGGTSGLVEFFSVNTIA